MANKVSSPHTHTHTHTPTHTHTHISTTSAETHVAFLITRVLIWAPEKSVHAKSKGGWEG